MRSYKIYFVDTKHKGKKTKVSVAKSKEDFLKTTVRELRQILQVEDDDDWEISTLLHEGQALDEERTLGSYAIKHKSVIHRTVKQPSGIVYFCLGFDYDSKAEGVSKTQSMEELTLMQNQQHRV